MRTSLLTVGTALLAACNNAASDPRGVEKGETFLTVSATGRADTRPDEARLRLGVTSIGPSAAEASRLNRDKMERVAAALDRLGIKPDAMQTRNLSLQRIDYGPDRGRFQAQNVLEVTMRDMARVGDAVAAVTDAGANLVGGPDLQVSDRERANRSAYAQAYQSAHSRAEAYATAAKLRIVRVVNIVDGGETGVPLPYTRTMDVQAAAPPPVAAPPPPPVPFSPGVNTTEVRVRVDYALRPG